MSSHGGEGPATTAAVGIARCSMRVSSVVRQSRVFLEKERVFAGVACKKSVESKTGDEGAWVWLICSQAFVGGFGEEGGRRKDELTLSAVPCWREELEIGRRCLLADAVTLVPVRTGHAFPTICALGC